METASTYETSINFYQTTRRNNSEDNLHTRRRENLKSDVIVFGMMENFTLWTQHRARAPERPCSVKPVLQFYIPNCRLTGAAGGSQALNSRNSVTFSLAVRSGSPGSSCRTQKQYKTLLHRILIRVGAQRVGRGASADPRSLSL
jgi:hypothetical protein